MIRQNNGQKDAPGDVSGKTSEGSERHARPDRQAPPAPAQEPPPAPAQEPPPGHEPPPAHKPPPGRDLPGHEMPGQASGGTRERTAAGGDDPAWSAAQLESEELDLADLDKVDWGASADTLGAEAPFEGDVITRDVHLAAVEAETAELRDQLLRAVAEAENIRKRAARDVAEARKFAVTAFAKDIVPLTDNFQRVIEAVPADALASDPALKSLLEGVEMTDRQFLGVLERHGVKRIMPKGEIFDPHFHQAIAQLPNPELPAGTITDVAQPGFKLGERVLRPAMVVVAQGGPKPAKAAAAAAADPGAAESGPATATNDDGGPEESASAPGGGFGEGTAPADASGADAAGQDEK